MISRLNELAAIVATGLLVVACGGTSTASPTPGATATLTPTSTVAPAPAWTPGPYSPPIIGSAEHSGCCPVRFTAATNDERVSGDVFFALQSDEIVVADFGGAFEYGDMTLTTDAGVWEGWCSGGGWKTDATYADVSCWLEGSDAYEGLTYYQHLSVRDPIVEIFGIILPLPAPTR